MCVCATCDTIKYLNHDTRSGRLLCIDFYYDDDDDDYIYGIFIIIIPIDTPSRRCMLMLLTACLLFNLFLKDVT